MGGGVFRKKKMKRKKLYSKGFFCYTDAKTLEECSLSCFAHHLKHALIQIISNHASKCISLIMQISWENMHLSVIYSRQVSQQLVR